VGDPLVAVNALDQSVIQPLLSTTDRTPGDGFAVTIAGAIGEGWYLERSTDLQNWSQVATVTLAECTITDTLPNGTQAAFYRLKRVVQSVSYYSKNAVGFVQVTVPANGWNFIGNPLNNGNNTLDEIFPNPPFFFSVSKFNNATQQYLDTAFFYGAWDYGTGNNPITLGLGEGAVVWNPDTTPFDVVFIGEVPQGTLQTYIPTGSSLHTSLHPLGGNLANLNFPAEDFDSINFWDANQANWTDWNSYLPGSGWDLPPIASPGEAFWIQKSDATGITWERTVNLW
jgi:hypothetical protein